MNVTVLAMKQIAPLPIDELAQALKNISHVLIVEEAVTSACVHDAIAREFAQKQVYTLDLGSNYVPHGDMDSLYAHYGMDGKSIADHILEVLKIED